MAGGLILLLSQLSRGGERVEYLPGNIAVAARRRVSPVPVRYARQMGAEVVLAVDISSAPEGNPSSDTLQVLLQTFAIMGKSINGWELKEADVVVRPALAGMGSGDFANKKRAIDAGRAAMLRALPQLRAALEAKAHAP